MLIQSQEHHATRLRAHVAMLRDTESTKTFLTVYQNYNLKGNTDLNKKVKKKNNKNKNEIKYNKQMNNTRVK